MHGVLSISGPCAESAVSERGGLQHQQYQLQTLNKSMIFVKPSFFFNLLAFKALKLIFPDQLVISDHFSSSRTSFRDPHIQ